MVLPFISAGTVAPKLFPLYPFEYPEDAGEDDFYWSQGNIDWCQSIYSQDWESTYEGLVGLDNASVTGEPLSTEEIEAYLAWFVELPPSFWKPKSPGFNWYLLIPVV